MRATLRLLNAVSHTEVIDGRSITVVYLYGRTADGQSMAVRSPPQAPWVRAVVPLCRSHNKTWCRTNQRSEAQTLMRAF